LIDLQAVAGQTSPMELKFRSIPELPNGGNSKKETLLAGGLGFMGFGEEISIRPDFPPLSRGFLEETRTC
jgi:hypothetical protein